MGVPGPVDLERAGGLAVVGVAQIHRDAAEVVLELLHRVEVRAAPKRDRRVQPSARDEEQRESRADFFVVDADVATLTERHRALLVTLTGFNASAGPGPCSGTPGRPSGTTPPPA